MPMTILLILLGILIFFMTVFVLFILSSFKIKIKELSISNLAKKWEVQYKIEFGLYLFSKIKYFKLTISSTEEERWLQWVKKIQKGEKALENMLHRKPSKKEIWQYLRIANPELEEVDLKMKVDTEDVLLTTGIVTFLSSTIGILFNKLIKKYQKEKHFYEILPIYQNKNLIKIDLNCIICIKMVHIIHIIYIVLKKERGEENGRTSNRRNDDNSNEQHKGHDRRQYHYRRAN